MKKYSGFLSRLEREIAQLNDHMPQTKKSLSQLLGETSPAFITRDGQRSAVRREELEKLAEIIPSELHDQIMLPITILRRTSLGPGAHTIGGSKLEQFSILRILEKIKTPYEMWRQAKLPRIIYSPEVTLLRQKLQTTLTIGFGT
ncbi:MAG: DUF61 family protein [Candidatus Odinarchaeota archaeon]